MPTPRREVRGGGGHLSHDEIMIPQMQGGVRVCLCAYMCLWVCARIIMGCVIGGVGLGASVYQHYLKPPSLIKCWVCAFVVGDW